MLLNLLPGVRDIRVPLSAGIIWLLAGYLALASHFPEKDQATGALDSLYDLAGYWGSGATVAALLFTAYLVGILQPSFLADNRCWSAPWRVGQWIKDRRRKKRLARRSGIMRLVRRPARLDVVDKVGAHTAIELTQRIEALVPLSDDLNQRLRLLTAALGGPPDLDEGAAPDHEGVRHTVMLELLEEQEALAQKLRIQEKERLWLSYDQKTSEGEFRRSVSAPLLALVLVLIVAGSWWFALVLPVPVLLHHQGEVKDREARGELYQALLHDVIVSRILESVAAVHASVARRSDQIAGQR